MFKAFLYRHVDPDFEVDPEILHGIFPIGTSRSLFFPTTRKSPGQSIHWLLFNSTSSDTRKPELYSISSMAGYDHLPAWTGLWLPAIEQSRHNSAYREVYDPAGALINVVGLCR